MKSILETSVGKIRAVVAELSSQNNSDSIWIDSVLEYYLFYVLEYPREYDDLSDDALLQKARNDKSDIEFVKFNEEVSPFTLANLYGK